ncbi:MAG: hypothetical protein H0W83_02430 [Planctomycetes bacterium]|nr:hypothetical protein [Planctomycetota bacterium]
MDLPRSLLAWIVLTTVGSLWGEDGIAPAFADGFDGPLLSSAWTADSAFGSIWIDDRSFPGQSAAAFRSVGGGQRSMRITHDFGAPVRGTIHVRFFDAQPGSETLYEGVCLKELAHPERGAGLGVQDFDADFYLASIDGTGPAAQRGRYPQITTTPVGRTAGWHTFAFTVAPDGVVLAIDGRPVFAAVGDRVYDRLELYMSGPHWRPDTYAWFDDVRYEPSREPVGIAAVIAKIQAQERAVDAVPPPPVPPRHGPVPERGGISPRDGGGSDAMQTLLAATSHSDHVGITGARTATGLAYDQMMARPDALACCQRLVAEAVSAGKLYGLDGLKKLDPAAFTRAYPAVLTCESVVESYGGCCVSSSQIRDVAADMAGIDPTPAVLAGKLDKQDRMTYRYLLREPAYAPGRYSESHFTAHATEALLALLAEPRRPAAHAYALEELARVDPAAFERAAQSLENPEEIVPSFRGHDPDGPAGEPMTLGAVAQGLAQKKK